MTRREIQIIVASLLAVFSIHTPVLATEADTVSTSVNMNFQIKFTISPGTGYSWAVAEKIKCNHIISQRKETYEQPTASMDGGSGTQIFNFKALKKGRCMIKFIYTQPFMHKHPKNTKSKTFVINVN